MINTVNVNAFNQYISPLLEKCPDFVIEREVTLVVADICRRTGILRTTMELDTECGEAEYDLHMHDGLCAEMVHHCYIDSREIPSVLFDEVSAVYPYDWRETAGVPKVYSFRHRNHLTLIPVPSDEFCVTVDVSVSVEPTSKVVPEIFLKTYLDIVSDGVISRVTRIASQPYSSMENSALYGMRYEAGIARIKGEVARDFTRRSGRVKFNRIV